MKNLELGCDLLIAGFVDDEVRIFLVQGSGTVSYHSHFATAGTGGVIAEAALYQREHQKLAGLDRALYNVYEAKKLSEIAEGVGDNTSMVVLDPPKDEKGPIGFRKVDSEGFNELRVKYEEFGQKRYISGVDPKKILKEMN